MNTMEILSRAYDGIGTTEDYDTAYAMLTDGLTTDEENEVFCILTSAVTSEARKAFKAGFNAAMRLVTGATA